MREIALRVTVDHFNLLFRQKRGHGRIHVLIRTGDSKPFSFMAAATEAMAVPQMPTK